MTEAGLSKELRDFMATGRCLFHAASAQELKRQAAGTQYVSMREWR